MNSENKRAEEKKALTVKLKGDELIQAFVYSEIFGKPKCKTRRKGIYGAEGTNRRR